MTPYSQTPVQTGAFIGTKATAAVLGVSPYTVRRWVRQKKLPAVKIGHSWLIDQAAIAALTKRTALGPTAK